MLRHQQTCCSKQVVLLEEASMSYPPLLCAKHSCHTSTHGALWLPAPPAVVLPAKATLKGCHVMCAQVDDPPEADGPYLYHTVYTPKGSHTITRVSSLGPNQRQQVVVSDEAMHEDLQQAQALADVQIEGEAK